MARNFIRVLVVDDDPGRHERIAQWMPGDVRIVRCDSAGAAIGMLRRDPGSVYDGLMLDYDLGPGSVDMKGRRLSGEDAGDAAIAHLARTVRILVHSNDRVSAPRLARRLAAAGFDVERIPFEELSRSRVEDWIAAIQENLVS